MGVLQSMQGWHGTVDTDGEDVVEEGCRDDGWGTPSRGAVYAPCGQVRRLRILSSIFILHASGA
jgi:hypothetical protein